MQELRRKTVLVTGSTDGVGRLVATKLGEAAARVLLARELDDSGVIVNCLHPAPTAREKLRQMSNELTAGEAA